MRHRLDFRGNPERDRVRAWGMRVPLRYRMGEAFKKRLVSYGVEDGIEAVLVEQTRWSEYAHGFIQSMHRNARGRPPGR